MFCKYNEQVQYSISNIEFCTCSAHLSMFHMERRSRNTLIITIIIIIVIIIFVILCEPDT